MKRRVTSHPGTIILEDYLKPTGMTVSDLAKKLKVSDTMLFMIVNKKRGLSFEMCHKLSKLFRTSFDLWANLQFEHDKTTFLSLIKKKNFNRLKLPRRKSR